MNSTLMGLLGGGVLGAISPELGGRPDYMLPDEMKVRQNAAASSPAQAGMGAPVRTVPGQSLPQKSELPAWLFGLGGGFLR